MSDLLALFVVPLAVRTNGKPHTLPSTRALEPSKGRFRTDRRTTAHSRSATVESERERLDRRWSQFDRKSSFEIESFAPPMVGQCQRNAAACTSSDDSAHVARFITCHVHPRTDTFPAQLCTVSPLPSLRLIFQSRGQNRLPLGLPCPPFQLRPDARALGHAA